jgi:hypothetical protein
MPQKEFNVSQWQLANGEIKWYIIEQMPITKPGPKKGEIDDVLRRQFKM